jgi:hypothetical protein
VKACSKTRCNRDLNALQLFSHVFSPIVDLMVHKLKKTLEKREKKASLSFVSY